MHTVLWNALRKAAQWEKVSRLNSCHWYRHSTTTQVTQCLMQPECCSCWSWKIHIFRINLNWHLTKSLVDKSIAFAIVKTIKFNLQNAHLEVLWQLRSWLTLTLGECGCNATNGSNSLLSTPFCVVDKSLFVYVLVFVFALVFSKRTQLRMAPFIVGTESGVSLKVEHQVLLCVSWAHRYSLTIFVHFANVENDSMQSAFPK